MQTAPVRIRRPMKTLVVRVGHDAVWIAIAGLFCVVEGAVKVTEYTPAKLLRMYRNRRVSPAETDHSQVFAR